jgi:predicted DNA binding CopG/RHH family protein
MKKPLPRLESDDAAEAFIAAADLSDYDLSGMQMVRFEFQPKTERVNMRLPRPLLDAVKASAAQAGMPYQRFIRQALEAAVQGSASRRAGPHGHQDDGHR